MASEDDFKTQNEKSLSRQRATRKRRAEEKRVEDLRDEALDRASGSKERRSVRAAGEERLLSMLGRQSQQGGIYDVETGAYDPAFNKEGTDETVGNDGIDQLNVDDGSSTETFTLDVVKSNNTAGTATFNGSGVD